MEANGERLKSCRLKVAAGHLLGKRDYLLIGKVFFSKIFGAGPQDIGLQLCQLGRIMRRWSSWAFGPCKTEKLGWQNQVFMCIMGLYLPMIVLGQVGALRVVVVCVPSWLLVLVMAHETKHRIFIGWGFAYCGCMFVWLFLCMLWLHVKRKNVFLKLETKHKPFWTKSYDLV